MEITDKRRWVTSIGYGDEARIGNGYGDVKIRNKGRYRHRKTIRALLP